MASISDNIYNLVFKSDLKATRFTLAIGACYLAYWRGFGRIMEYRPPAIMGGEVAAVLAQWWVFVRYHMGADETEDRRKADRRSACRD